MNQSRFQKCCQGQLFFGQLEYLERSRVCTNLGIVWKWLGSEVIIIISKLKYLLFEFDTCQTKLVYCLGISKYKSKQKHKHNLFGYSRPARLSIITTLNFSFSYLLCFFYFKISLVEMASELKS